MQFVVQVRDERRIDCQFEELQSPPPDCFGDQERQVPDTAEEVVQQLGHEGELAPVGPCGDQLLTPGQICPAPRRQAFPKRFFDLMRITGVGDVVAMLDQVRR